MTPARFVQQVRVSAARALLEKPGTSVKSVAALTGFDSADSMRRAFLRVLAITPRQYMERFGG